MASNIRSLQQIYKSMKGRGSSTSNLSSYSRTLASRTQAAQDKVIDDNYANGVISTQTYLSELESRSMRVSLTPLQRTNLSIKMRDVQQTFQDEQIQTAYKTGGFFEGNKVDDSFMLAYEKSKLDGMDVNSTAYQQQQQKVLGLQDKADKAARSTYRQETLLKLSQSPDANWSIMEQKAELYQQLADEAKADGDNTGYMTLQTTANNYKESATKAKTAAEYQEKLFKTKTDTNETKSDIKFGTQGGTSGELPGNPATPPAQESTPSVNEDGTVTPGQSTSEVELQPGILDDFNGINWSDLSDYFTEDDYDFVTNKQKSIENRQKAIDMKIADANAAYEKYDAAQEALDKSVIYDEKLKYAREMTTQSELAIKYSNEADLMSSEFDTAMTDAINAVDDRNKAVAKRLIGDKENKIELALASLDQDLMDGNISKEDYLSAYSELNVAKQELFYKSSEVFSNIIFDETKSIDYQQKALGMRDTMNKVEAYQSNPDGFELVVDANTGKVSPKFVNEDKSIVERDKNGNPVPGSGSLFDRKYQKIGNAYVELRYRDKNGIALTPQQIKDTDLDDLNNIKKYKKEATIWQTVVKEEVDGNGNVVKEIPQKRIINATFDANGDIDKYSYKDENGETRNLTSIPERSTEKNFLQKAIDWAGNAVSSVGDVLLQDRQNTANTVKSGYVNDFFKGNLLRNMVNKSSEDNLQGKDSSLLRSLNPFGIQKAYADTSKSTTLAGIPEEYAARIIEVANKNGIEPGVLAGLLAKESWDFKDEFVHGYHQDGTGRGIAAIDKTWHPEITDEQAFDANFAIDWAGNELGNLIKKTGSVTDGLRAYNRGLSGYKNAPESLDYANNVLERAKIHVVTTPGVKPVSTTLMGLRSQNPIDKATTFSSQMSTASLPQKDINPVNKIDTMLRSSVDKLKTTNKPKKSNVISNDYSSDQVSKGTKSVMTPEVSATKLTKPTTKPTPLQSAGIKVDIGPAPVAPKPKKPNILKSIVSGIKSLFGKKSKQGGW